jgi:MinD superfamily P-loop ATPase
MTYKIAVASGKGGTGKTSVAVNLLKSIYENWTEKVQLLDCDVEEPNALLFFKGIVPQKESIVNQFVPVINKDNCTFCGNCVSYCEFNAISFMESVNYIEVHPDLCHSCGACLHACQHEAIKLQAHPIGRKSEFKTAPGPQLKEGSLRVGSPMQTKLIKELKSPIDKDMEVVIFDAPPGTSCPVVETTSSADYVILVTEPTPFGLYDLKLTVDLMKEMNKSFGVIVNKAGMGNTDVYQYLKEEAIEIIGEIPFDKEYAKLYAKGKLLEEIPAEMKIRYQSIMKTLQSKLFCYEGNHCS